MKKYDLIVVGAGNLGTFHAYHALQMGKSVLMIEKDSEPMEATVRNFGQVVPSGQALDTWFEYGRRSLEIYQNLQDLTDITARKNGSYYFASDDDEAKLLEEARALFKIRGYACELMNRKVCFERMPMLQNEYYKLGLFFPHEFSVEPRTMVHRVREILIKKWGLTFLNNTTIIDCQIKNGVCEVVSSKGEKFYAEKVAICNGRDFKALFPNLFENSGMKVSKLNMMSTYPLKDVQIKGNILSGLSIRRYDSFKSCASYPQISQPEWQKPYNAWGIHILFKQAFNGSIIIGDSHEYAGVNGNATLDFGIDMDINQLILKEAQRIMKLPNWNIQNYWAGYYSQTADGGIYEHQLENKIYIATGIGGKGMTTSPGYAEKRIKEVFSQ